MQIPKGARFRFGGKCAPGKYGSRRTEADGYTFDSKKEADRYADLKLRLHAGEIRDLRLQVPYPITINGQVLCRYVADFVYFDVKAGREVVEDVKSPATARKELYRLKKKAMRLEHGIEILEV